MVDRLRKITMSNITGLFFSTVGLSIAVLLWPAHSAQGMNAGRSCLDVPSRGNPKHRLNLHTISLRQRRVFQKTALVY